MSKVMKKVFKTTTTAYENGKEVDKEVELAVLPPSTSQKNKARLVYAKAWREAVEAGAIMREALDAYLREQKLWDDIREKDYADLRKKILEGERRLGMGGNAGLTRTKAKELALQIGDWREEIAALFIGRNRVDVNTAEAVADQTQFNYFVANCTVYNDTGKPFFTVNGIDPAVEAYMDRATEPAAREAANHFADLWYGDDKDAVDKTPEKQFLKEHKFIDDKGRLIDKQGRLIDRKGRFIDENDRFVNEAGQFVDADGNPVDESGHYIVDFSPFLEDPDEETPPPTENEEIK